MAGRRTGRTTRMLERAVALAMQGRAVYVYVAGDEQRARQKLQEISGAPFYSFGIKVEHGFPRAFDWTRMRPYGAHPNCTALIDHYLIERELALMLAELHRYDGDSA